MQRLRILLAAVAATLLPAATHGQTTWLDATSGSNSIATDITSGSAGLTVGLGFYVDYLIVAGGGGGSGRDTGGGGGGGGVVTNVGGTLFRLTNTGTVVVGDGGAGGVDYQSGFQGGASSFGGTTACGVPGLRTAALWKLPP